MFSFEKADGLEENDFRNISILSSFICKHEIYGVREITELLGKNLIEKGHIKHVFLTDYSFEIISTYPEILSQNDTIYNKLAAEISKIAFKNCYNSNENTNCFDFPAIVTSLRIITCDTLDEILDEIKELTNEYELKKVTEYLYTNNYNSFNFISAPWDNLFFPNLIVTLKPETMAKNMNTFHQSADKFGSFVTYVHSIGKIYAISESIHKASIDLMITSWNLDEIFNNLESTFKYPNRILYNNEKDFYNLFREFKESVIPLTLADQTYQVKIFEQEYGPIIGFQIEDALNTLNHSDAKEFLCFFSWYDVLGNDNERFIGFLNQRYGINWVKTAEIETIDDDGAIKVFSKENYIYLRLNDDKTQVNIKIDDGRIYKLSARLENSKLNIYEFLTDPNLIIDAFQNDIKIFGKILIEFLNKFQSLSNTWREIYRSKINHYQMLIAMGALIISIAFSGNLWQLLGSLKIFVTDLIFPVGTLIISLRVVFSNIIGHFASFLVS